LPRAIEYCPKGQRILSALLAEGEEAAILIPRFIPGAQKEFAPTEPDERGCVAGSNPGAECHYRELLWLIRILDTESKEFADLPDSQSHPVQLCDGVFARDSSVEEHERRLGFHFTSAVGPVADKEPVPVLVVETPISTLGLHFGLHSNLHQFLHLFVIVDGKRKDFGGGASGGLRPALRYFRWLVAVSPF